MQQHPRGQQLWNFPSFLLRFYLIYFGLQFIFGLQSRYIFITRIPEYIYLGATHYACELVRKRDIIIIWNVLRNMKDFFFDIKHPRSVLLHKVISWNGTEANGTFYKKVMGKRALAVSLPSFTYRPKLNNSCRHQSLDRWRNLIYQRCQIIHHMRLGLLQYCSFVFFFLWLLHNMPESIAARDIVLL